MNLQYGRIKPLFLRQSYLDSWEDYARSLRKKSFIKWDYIILTASNEDQAEAYREQIAYRLEQNLLPKSVHYAVIPDPDGKRVGSGGATFNVLKYIAEQDSSINENHFSGKRILVIHSGGDSKRVPQYSACGKLFSPVPRELPNGRFSTLFDEFIIGMSGVPSRIPEGMLVLSGDVLLLFNPLQIDFQYHGAAAISIKEHVSTGKNHGVFLNDGTDYVGRFLHKQSEEQLHEWGAVNQNGNVDLDTGAIIMDSELLNALYSLISTDNQIDPVKFDKFVNEKARVSFYGDFLYPLAKESTEEGYYREAPEGSFCTELQECREEIWRTIHGFHLKLLCLSPAEFIHFGTTRELIALMTEKVEDYSFLDWKRKVLSSLEDGHTDYAVHNSFIDRDAKIGQGTYLEDVMVNGNTMIGSHSVMSNVVLKDVQIPDNTVLHALPQKEGGYVVRIYGTDDNPKGRMSTDAAFLCTTLKEFVENNELSSVDLWENEEDYLWFAKLYPVCDTIEEGVEAALLLEKMACGKASGEEVQSWKDQKRVSLYESFNHADVKKILINQRHLENRIRVERFVEQICQGMDYKEALKAFNEENIGDEEYAMLMDIAKESDFSTKIRIYYDLSRYMKKNSREYQGVSYDVLERRCFETIQQSIYQNAKKNIGDSSQFYIAKEEVQVNLPLRVNWGGGWTDTPPYCNEHGGAVLNAAISLRGNYPVQVRMRKLKEFHIEFESQDVGVFGTVKTVAEVQDCHNPYDPFALHKAALIATGIVPIEGDCNLQKVLERLGGGIYLSTEVTGVPKGSGLGTSSILAGACVKAIYDLVGQEVPEKQLFEIVLCMEQIMSTGGGWQDQVGGIVPGVKMITTRPGIEQKIQVQHLQLDEKTKKELQDRFVLIYTGQRRLARNLLRDVVGGYISGREQSIRALGEMEQIAALMKFELERGHVDEFAKLLNRHWELSRALDMGSTNTCIDQIFVACEDLIDGKFIAGAGGGGFLQVILKKGVAREKLQERLKSVFQDSGVEVWNCELLLG